MFERRRGQWLLVLAALAALAAMRALHLTEAVLLTAGLLAVVAIADRRPSGTPFRPAEDTLDLVLALSGWLVSPVARHGPKGPRPLNGRR